MTKMDDTKEEVTHDMENLRKKNETEIQNTMQGHSSRLEQENRISELEDKMEIRGKLKRAISQTTQDFERNMQELTDHQKTKPKNHGH
jgi:gas vesicle protein